MTTLADVVQHAEKTFGYFKGKDFCPNGLQIQATDLDSKASDIVCGVSLCEELVEEALTLNANILFVHHGIFWGPASCLKGTNYRIVKQCMKYGLNVLSYHLPLDYHPEIGNNVSLAQQLGLSPYQNGKLIQQLSPNMLLCNADGVKWSKLQNTVQCLREVDSDLTKYWGKSDSETIGLVGICTGAGQHYFQEAIDLGVDCFITGEFSLPQYHTAFNEGVGFIAMGHHASECFGVQEYCKLLEKDLNITYHEFIDLSDPV